VEKFCKKLGYSFKNKSLLIQALTHRSYKPQHNERLEFLGDAVLNFIISDQLFTHYPEMTEGELSRARANLVNGEVLATLSCTLEVDQHIQLGQGEIKNGGMTRQSILSDCLEALIGAIYVDGGLETCRKIVLSWYIDKFKQVALKGPQKDPKTMLQEYCQGNRMKLPQYTVVNIRGEEHKQTFQIRCEVEDFDIKALGEGSSRRKAEQSAAERFLNMIESPSKKLKVS
jgi:ribonuclease-3